MCSLTLIVQVSVSSSGLRTVVSHLGDLPQYAAAEGLLKDLLPDLDVSVTWTCDVTISSRDILIILLHQNHQHQYQHVVQQYV